MGWRFLDEDPTTHQIFDMISTFKCWEAPQKAQREDEVFESIEDARGSSFWRNRFGT